MLESNANGPSQRSLTGSVHGELEILDVSKPSKDFVQMGLRYILGQFFHDDLID